jgi:hypothetical protein
MPRALGVEDETERIGAGGNGGIEVFFAGNAANLDSGSAHASEQRRIASAPTFKFQAGS